MSKSGSRATWRLRRGVLAGLVAVLACCVAAPTAGAQTTIPLDLTITSHLGKKKQAEECGIVLCGTTTLPGFGTADYTLIAVADPTPTRGCEPATAFVTFDLRSTHDLLTVEVDGQVCYPGNSNVAPGALKSFGNPLRATGTFTITGGTGVFEGATGSGTATLFAAGARVNIKATGTLTLP
jgi:hypothetical protein